mmetsp:Transcript_37776/g.89701  ORF Transcript_37776/g.89701 Transcript_37776/m.89701 type:complete len:226 (+) Transcript_37776:82-759(+)
MGSAQHRHAPAAARGHPSEARRGDAPGRLSRRGDPDNRARARGPRGLRRGRPEASAACEGSAASALALEELAQLRDVAQQLPPSRPLLCARRNHWRKVVPRLEELILECLHVLLGRRAALLPLVRLGEDDREGHLGLRQPVGAAGVDLRRGDARVDEQQHVGEAPALEEVVAGELVPPEAVLLRRLGVPVAGEVDEVPRPRLPEMLVDHEVVDAARLPWGFGNHG